MRVGENAGNLPRFLWKEAGGAGWAEHPAPGGDSPGAGPPPRCLVEVGCGHRFFDSRGSGAQGRGEPRGRAALQGQRGPASGIPTGNPRASALTRSAAKPHPAGHVAPAGHQLSLPAFLSF